VIDFVCMANEGYLHWVELCVKAIGRQHPGSTIHLFDLSESSDSRIRVQYSGHAGVRYVHFPPAQWTWPAWIDSMGFDFAWPRFGLRETLKYHSRRLRQLFGARNENWMTDKAAHTRRVRQALRLFAQKPQVIKRSLAATRNDLVFIDVDAIVLKPLDPVFDLEFDLAVTCEEPRDVVVGPEPKECIERPSYPYQAINVGVVFLRNSARMQPLLEAWIRKMETVHHMSIEQTALAQLIYEGVPAFFREHFRARTLALEGGASVSVMALPMRRYNFTRIRRTDEALGSDLFVAHFAGGKKQQQHWDWVRGMIGAALGE
jgi:hypothetical protein